MANTKSNKSIGFYAIEAVLKNNNEKYVASILSDFATSIFNSDDDEKKDVIRLLQKHLMKVVGDHHGIHRVIPIEDGNLKAEIEVVLHNQMRLNVKNNVPPNTQDGYQLMHCLVTLHIPCEPGGTCGDLTCIIPWREGGLELLK